MRRESGVGDLFEIGEEPLAPVGGFAFQFHRVDPDVSGVVVDAEEEVDIASD